SNMSHEFRTPLNSITALSHLLLERMDGPLTPEQEKQVGFIRQGARDLTELVNDLLDLAKVEAGKVTVRPVEFDVESLFGALRGMLRPLLVNESLRLVFEPAADIPPLHTDEGKVSQILRNFISNALKYTEQGEVRVSATLADGGAAVAFAVADTGIGIAPEDQERIFEEFLQVEHTLQSRVKGTGLGLPLARKLTQLLGGRITLVSEPGIGSTFTATIPCVFAAPAPLEAEAEAAPEAAPLGRAVLVVENGPRVLSIYDRYFRESEFRMIPARSLRDARRALAMEEPEAIILDILLDGEEAWNFLAELRSKPATQAIPVAVVSNVDDRRKALALGADSYALKPVTREWLLGELERLAGGRRVPAALVIGGEAGGGDLVKGLLRPGRCGVGGGRPRAEGLITEDDDGERYLLKRLLSQVRCRVTEMPNGVDGLRAARDRHPDIIFLDLVMPDVSGFDLLSHLKADPASADIPVVVVTSKVLEPDERSELERRSVAVLWKPHTPS